MKSFLAIAGGAVLVLTGMAGSYWLGARVKSWRGAPPRVFVWGPSVSPLGRARDIWDSCPHIALSLEPDAADYTIGMLWIDDHWQSLVKRGSSILLADDHSPDFNKLLRQACRAISRDASTWPLDDARAITSQPAHADESARYELRDIIYGDARNSALLDRRTGKVWIWLKDPKSPGGGFFLEEDVTPVPGD